MNMHSVLELLPIVAVFIVWIVFMRWHFNRSQAVLEHWAEQYGCEILRREYCFFYRGPFFWTTSRGQTVYYVRVRDPQGQERTGWVRCGGWFWGLWSDAAEVRWEDER